MTALATYQRLTKLALNLEIDGPTTQSLAQSFALAVVEKVNECDGTVPDLGRWCRQLLDLSQYRAEAAVPIKEVFRSSLDTNKLSAESSSALCSLLRTLLSDDTIESQRYDSLTELPLPADWPFTLPQFRRAATACLCSETPATEKIEPIFKVSLKHLATIEKTDEYALGLDNYTEAYRRFDRGPQGAPTRSRRRRQVRRPSMPEEEPQQPQRERRSFFSTLFILATTFAFVSTSLVMLAEYVTEKPKTVSYQKPAAEGKPPEFGKAFINSLGQQFHWLEDGEFHMGSDVQEEHAKTNESPSHKVTFKKGFWCGATEVTQSQYEQLMGRNPSCFPGANNPVEQVSWLDAVSFCRKLTKREEKRNLLPKGWIYTIPSEAQWEYACRAFSTGPTYGSQNTKESLSEILDKLAWFTKNTRLDKHITARPIDKRGNRKERRVRFSTRPVGKKVANGFGLHDMLGNVQEWCLDCWHETYDGAPRDGSSWTSADGTIRVRRGGSWHSEASRCRTASRGRLAATAQKADTGFRVVLTQKSAH